MSDEEWEIIQDLPAFEVSSRGRVRRISDGWMPKLARMPSGHLSLEIRTKPGSRYRHPVHRVMAMAFIGPPPFDGAVCRHLNDIPDDNRLDNLAWGSRRDNSMDAIANGRIKLGEDRHLSKLTNETIRQAFAMRRKRMPYTAIGASLGVCEAAVREAIKGRRWKHLATSGDEQYAISADDLAPIRPRGSQNNLAKLDEAKVRVIIGRIRLGHRNTTIAADYGVHPDTIGLIKRKKLWRHVHDELTAAHA
jgi:hypothetical protein